MSCEEWPKQPGVFAWRRGEAAGSDDCLQVVKGLFTEEEHRLIDEGPTGRIKK